MEFYVTQPDMELLTGTAPESVLRTVEKYKTVLICAFDKGKMVSYAAFSQPNEKAPEIWLEYVFTAPALRQQGYATGVLDHASRYFKDHGASCILLRVLSKPDSAREYVEFFTKRKYLPLMLTGRLLVYEVDDMMDPGIFQLLEKKRSKLPQPISYEEASKLTLFKTVPIEIMEEEREFSCFFALKGAIFGAAAASLEDEDTLVIREIYLEKEAEKKGMFLPMLYAVVESAKKIVKENMKLQLYLSNEAGYKGLMQLFNPPEDEYLLMEFMNCLLFDAKEGN